jgi:hypothetical protein
MAWWHPAGSLAPHLHPPQVPAGFKIPKVQPLRVQTEASLSLAEANSWPPTSFFGVAVEAGADSLRASIPSCGSQLPTSTPSLAQPPCPRREHLECGLWTECTPSPSSPLPVRVSVDLVLLCVSMLVGCISSLVGLSPSFPPSSAPLCSHFGCRDAYPAIQERAVWQECRCSFGGLSSLQSHLVTSGLFSGSPSWPLGGSGLHSGVPTLSGSDHKTSKKC